MRGRIGDMRSIGRRIQVRPFLFSEMPQTITQKPVARFPTRICPVFRRPPAAACVCKSGRFSVDWLACASQHAAPIGRRHFCPTPSRSGRRASTTAFVVRLQRISSDGGRRKRREASLIDSLGHSPQYVSADLSTPVAGQAEPFPLRIDKIGSHRNSAALLHGEPTAWWLLHL